MLQCVENLMIKPPNFQKNAIPTRRGWVNPDTGEIVKGGSIAQTDIDSYLSTIYEVESEIVIEPDPETMSEWIGSNYEDEEEVEWDWEYEEVDLDLMSKAELIETAEDWEVEIDPKATKAQIKAILLKELD